jgi:hypothetical protein
VAIMTAFALITLAGAFFLGCEVAAMALDRLSEHRGREDVKRDVAIDAALFLIAASGVITSCWTLSQLWIR